MAGFSVGIVDKDKIIDGSKLEEGNVIIGIQSSGVHSNGYSLVRKVFNINDSEECVKRLHTYSDELGTTIGEALLTPTKIYVKPVLALLEEVDVKAISHITGGGFYENIPRSIPDGFGAKIDKASVKVLPIFDYLAKVGNISERDMFNTYNMGVGMSIVVAPEECEKALSILKEAGEDAYIIGEIVKSDSKIEII